MGNFDLIIQTAGGAASSGTFDQDAFLDISVPATNNTGLTSNASTNPLGDFFNDDDVPRYSAKTLWIKDYQLIQDRNLWVSNKPTYRIVFNENFTPVHGYAFGDIDFNFGVARRIGDGFGVTGNVRRIFWIVRPNTAATATGQLSLDGANTTTVDFSSALTPSQNSLAYLKAESANETNNIHDYRLTAIQNGTLQVVGVIVYSENSGANIQCNPGSTYNNKLKQSNTNGSTLALPSYGSSLGGKTTIYKSGGNVYTLNSVGASTVLSVAQGSSGTNILNVSPGDGSKFSPGDAVVINGLNPYVGNVLSISTDALTMGVTLTQGLSQSCYRVWSSGSTLAIGASIYQLAYTIDPSLNAIYGTTTASYNYQENGDWVLWGSNFRQNIIDGYQCIQPIGATFGSVRVDGSFQAAAIEFIGAGILHATFLVNGIQAWGINAGQTGPQKKTVMLNAGPGWNSFEMDFGSSMGVSIGISRIDLYQRYSQGGVTYGFLAELETNQAMVSPYTSLSNGGGLGVYRRVYADFMYFGGGNSYWIRGLTTGAAGGVQYVGATLGQGTLTHSFYGKAFSIIGQLGASYTFTIDGGSATTVAFNAVSTLSSEAWHTLVYSHQSGSCAISAIDVYRTTGSLNNIQNASPIGITYPLKSIDFDVSGLYSAAGQSQTGVLFDVVTRDIKVVDVKLLIKTAGITGTTQVDIQVKGYDGFTSIFTVLPYVDSTVGSNYLSSQAVLAKSPYVLSKDSILRMDIQSAQIAGKGFLLKLFYTEAP